jgi:coiled-coil and C2 domain-containing protein 2A
MTVRYAENWVKPFISQNRNVLALAQTMQGKTTIVCRYISPLKPPENFDTLKKVVRFVAVIPFLDNKIAFSARCSLWSTADEIHALGSGDGIEHAILLCNYCLDLKLNAWVVLGSDLVDNNMAYVLVKKPKAQKEQTRRRSWIINSLMRGFDSEFDYDIYDPVNGLNYQIGDPSCPLLEMHCAFNSDNVTNFKIDLGQHTS